MSSPLPADLFEAFPPVSDEAWREKIRKDLSKKGPELDDAALDKKLVWRTGEGVDVRAYYRRGDLEQLDAESAPGQFPFTRGRASGGNDWSIRHAVRAPDVSRANHKALYVLERGANAVEFSTEILEPATRAGSDGKAATGQQAKLRGTPIQSLAAMQKLLDGIWLDQCGAHFRAGAAAAPAVLALFLNELERQGIDPASVPDASIDYDPLGYLLRQGRLPAKRESSFGLAAELVRFANQSMPGLRPLVADAAVCHEAGASLVQELAFALSAGHEYLAQLTARGLSADEIAPRIEFRFATGGQYFLEIARMRAARMLWARIVREYKPENEASCAMRIHAETSRFNKSIYDPYNNLVRACTEAMSAAIGAADSLTVLPFDEPYKTSDDFSERIALNIQHLLKHEGRLEKVQDPAAGSYYVEELTEIIAREAWGVFRVLEQTGGFLSAFESGLIQHRIAESREKLVDHIKKRRTVLLGVNQYPNQKERMLDQIETPVEQDFPLRATENLSRLLSDPGALPYLRRIAREEGKSLADLSSALREASDVEGEPAPAFRAAEVFEELRLQTERSVQAGGKRPHVFLFAIGNPVMRRARAGFAANFFAVAGFEIGEENYYDSAEDGARAAADAGADIVVLCSSDEEYAEIGPAACAALRSAGSDARIVVAGNPESLIESLKEAGVEHFIHMGANLYEELRNFQSLLGVREAGEDQA